MDQNDIKVGSTVYAARIIPNISYDVNELTIRTITDTYFVGVDTKTRRSYIFEWSEYEKTVFRHRSDALEKVKDAESHRTKIYQKRVDLDDDD